jgi:hypothetical protein
MGNRARGRQGAAFLVCALLLMAGCRAAMDPVVIQDTRTAAQVKTILINDPAVGTRTIEVTVVRGVARLAGTVRTQEEIDRAVALSRSVQGVHDVQVALEIGPSDSTPEPQPRGQSQSATESEIGPDDARLFAVGVTVGWSGPTARALDSGLSLSPLFRFGSGRGLGPTIALDWFTSDITGSSSEAVESRVHVRPLMGGVSYTLGNNRVSVAPSIVSGVAFNSLTVPVAGEAGGIAVEVGNSFIWRPGVSMWIDLNRRAAVNLSMGYAFTRLNVTFLEGTQLVQRDVPGDTSIVHVGMVYKVF